MGRKGAEVKPELAFTLYAMALYLKTSMEAWQPSTPEGWVIRQGRLVTLNDVLYCFRNPIAPDWKDVSLVAGMGLELHAGNLGKAPADALALFPVASLQAIQQEAAQHVEVVA